LEEARSSHFLKFFGESLVVFCILAGISIVSIPFLPAFMLPMIFIPVPLVFIAVRRGFFYGLLPFVLIAALFWLWLGITGAALFTALFAPAVVFLYYVIGKKVRSFESVVYAVGSFALGIALVIGYIYLTARMDLMTYLLNGIKAAMEKVPMLPYSLLQLLNIQDILTLVKNPDAILMLPSADALSQALAGVRNYLAALLPIAFSVFSLLGGLLNYVIVRAILKKKNTEVAPIPEFSRFKLPKGFFAGMVIIGVMLIAGSLLGLQGLDAVFSTCLVAYVIVFSICGLALIDFIMKRRNATRGGRIALLIVTPLLGFMFLGVQIFYALAVMGLLEAILKVRDRIEKPDEFDGE